MNKDFVTSMIPFIIVGLMLFMGTLLFAIIKQSIGNKLDGKLIKLYIKLDNFPLTGNKIRNITRQLQYLAIYQRKELYIKSALNYIQYVATVAVVSIISMFVFKDAILGILCVIAAMSIAKSSLVKKVDTLTRLVFNELRMTLSSLRQEFLATDSVTESLQKAEYGEILRHNFDEILTILTSTKSELRLKEFFEKTPFRHLQTLARVCYEVNNTGDEKDVHGNSNFVQATTIISSDVNQEIQRMEYQRAKFKGLNVLALVCIPFIPIVEYYFIDTMPGTALIYRGNIGYISRVLTALSGIIVFNIISGINSTQSIKDDDRIDWCSNSLENRGWKKFIRTISPKNDKRRELAETLKNCLSKKTIEEVYVEKVIYAIVVFISSVIITVSTVNLSKDFMSQNTQSLSLVADNVMENYSKESILALDNRYIEMFREKNLHGGNIRDEEIAQMVKGAMPGLTDLQVLDQVKRIKDKANSIENTYFRWQFVPMSFLLACLAWMIPNINLKIRAFLVKTEAEEDFLQLQTLMTIIAESNADTLDAIEQLSQVSKIHKDYLIYCFNSFPSNPEMELARLESKTNILEFKRFIGKLKTTVNDLSLKEAFSDLALERDHIVKMREQAMRSAIDKKRNLCGLLCKIPIALFVIGEVLIPIGYLGYLEYINGMASMV